MDLQLRGRAFLVTGGSSGLGLALARTLVAEGARVALCGRDLDRLTSAQREFGDLALCVQADVTNAGQLDAFVDRTVNHFGRLDGVVSNAGRASAGPVETTTLASWRDDFDLKVAPVVRLIQRTADALAHTSGSLLTVLSITARSPAANSTPTAATRAAGLALTKALAAELGPRRVRANAILVGLVESGQWERAAGPAGDVTALYQRVAADHPIPLGRFGRADEFAALAAFVLSPRASYLTGAAINLDGGLSPVS